MEFLRRVIRGVVGADNLIYRCAARLADDLAVISREGFKTWNQLRKAMSESASAGVEAVKLQRLQHPILIRRGTMDVVSIISNCIREEYGQFSRSFDARLIVDAGAYIGDTAIYFLNRFPSCTVVALEPCEDSYAQAETNLSFYRTRVHLVKAALWDKVGRTKFGGEQTAASVGEGNVEVATTTIPKLLEQYGYQHYIDILKMDIEGAERVVLASGDKGWLRKVRLLLLETHGREIETEVLPLLRSNGFRCRRFRNLWYCRNQDL